MKVNAKNLPRHDLIGLDVKIVSSSNKSLIGLKGRIVNETRNTLEIEEGNKVRKIMKSQVVLEVELDSHTYHVDGKLLVGRPEDRIKKVRSLK